MVIPGADTPNGAGYVIDHYLVVFNNTPDELMPQVAKFLEFMSDSTVIQIFKDGNQGKMSSRASVMDEVFADVSEITQVRTASACGRPALHGRGQGAGERADPPGTGRRCNRCHD